MKRKYLIRLDDACPVMKKERWDTVELILDRYHITPLVGIVPHCEDENISTDRPDKDFWLKARRWQDKNWAIALHGYNHVYSSDEGGINPLWNRSEFAGLPLDLQRKKIRDGLSVFKNYGICAKYFFAPSHTFDMNTLEALKEESSIRIISDTIALEPYKLGEFVFIPQFGGLCREIPFPGTFTFCLHPSTMNDEQFKNLENFLKLHTFEFISFSDIDISKLKKKSTMSRLFSFTYFTLRNFRRL